MEDLVIPLKLDSRQAMSDLQRMASEGRRAGKETQEGLEGASKAGAGLGSVLTDVISHNALQLLRETSGLLVKTFQETADHVKSVSKEFTQLQETLRIIATFKGEKLTDEFTVDLARKGAAAGLTPEQQRNFEKQFQGFAGQFMGEGKKFTSAQGEELGQRAAAFMNVRGIDPSQGGAIFGEILQQATGKESTDELMAKFGKAYVVLEQAKGDPAQLLGQVGQVTAQGVDVQTGAKLMRAMAQRDPGEAGTSARAVLRGLASVRTEGKAGELGITEDMDVFKQLEQINKMAPKQQKAREDFIRSYFKDEREFSGVMAGINFGVEGGLFAQADIEAGQITGKTDIDAVKEFKKDPAGRRIFNRAELAAERVATGARKAGIDDAKVIAEKELEKEGRFDEVTPGDLLRGAIPFGPSVKEQLINERALANVQKQTGIESKFLTTIGMGESELNREILGALHQANEQRKEGNTDRKAVTQKPLIAPPPKPTERP